MSYSADMSARRQKRELRSRPWVNNSVVRSRSVPKPAPSSVANSKNGRGSAPLSRLPVFKDGSHVEISVRHTPVDSLLAGSRLPQLATRSRMLAEKKQKRDSAILKSSGAAGVVESSPPQIPVKEQVEARRVVSNSSDESEG
ncbi:hypothetical protein PMZ80_003369 [Knufia obscura]|uniref:Uncharacterized protein n=2 Tax=Knufia TaxID=430999 RepID=A0AAN8EI24_9EURO|nr:hypothetical protein PMZ80_003369 [Knufia obscura]KAK5956369.1 hypothetical protein OHC33_002946 [Knufia fluminis]